MSYDGRLDDVSVLVMSKCGEIDRVMVFHNPSEADQIAREMYEKYKANRTVRLHYSHRILVDGSKDMKWRPIREFKL